MWHVGSWGQRLLNDKISIALTKMEKDDFRVVKWKYWGYKVVTV
jgi:hypothetical protein